MSNKTYKSKNGVVIETTTHTEERILTIQGIDSKLQHAKNEVTYWNELRESVVAAKEEYIPPEGEGI